MLFTKTSKFFLIISVVLIVASTIGMFLTDKLFSPIIGFVSVNTLIITLAFAHIKRTNSSRIFGAYLSGIILLYFWINFNRNSFFHPFYNIISLLLLVYGLTQLISGGDFNSLSKTAL